MTDEEAKAARIAGSRRRAEERAAAQAAVPQEPPALPAEEPPPVAMPPIAHEGERAHDPIAGMLAAAEPWVEGDTLDAPDEPLDDFARFLASQDGDIRSLLSDMELRVIYEAEQKRAADEKRIAAKKLAVARAQRHARATAGLIGHEAVAAAALREDLNRKVSWVVNMPEAGNSGTLIDAGVRIDGVLYPHGTEMTGTKGEYISYREIEYRAHENERQFQGRSRMSRLAQTGMRFLNNEVHL